MARPSAGQLRTSSKSGIFLAPVKAFAGVANHCSLQNLQIFFVVQCVHLVT